MVTRVGVVVLAAGRSSRFGDARAHKLLAPIRGVPLVRLSVSAAVEADVGEVVVVTGAEGTTVAASLDGLPVRVVHEPSFADGMAMSLSRGVRSFPTHAAVVIGLGDQPGALAESYRRIVARWRNTGASIVVPRYAGAVTPAHPTLFAALVFDELLALRGDVGARSVIARDPSRVVEETLEWPPPRDVDTVEDLQAVTAEVTATRSHAVTSTRTDDSR